MSLVLKRSNSICENIQSQSQNQVPTWEKFWAALEFWYLRQRYIDEEINNEKEIKLFEKMTDDAKIKIYKFLIKF